MVDVGMSWEIFQDRPGISQADWECPKVDWDSLGDGRSGNILWQNRECPVTDWGMSAGNVCRGRLRVQVMSF